MRDREEGRSALLDALHELLDVSQGLGLHQPSPAERTEVRTKARVVREQLERMQAQGTGSVAATLLPRVHALVAMLDAEHDPERWRATRQPLVTSYEQLQASARSPGRVGLGGRLRLKPHNLRRTLFHAGSGIAWAIAYEYLFDRTQMLLALGAFLAVFATDDIMRRWFPDRRSRFAVATFRLLSRPSESARVASSTWYTVGMLVGVLVLPDYAFLLGLLVLALADPAAALVGRRFGRQRLYRDKSVLGTAAFFGVAMLIAVVVIAMRVPGLTPMSSLVSSALIAGAGTVAELLGDHVQDNVSILLTTGITAALLL